ncbi:MAG: hypothetical protein ACRCY9_21750 [Phycicoccus sp.]
MSTAVFPDTTVFCNFAAVGSSTLLGTLLRGRGRWTDAVMSEVEQSRGYLPDLQQVLTGGWMGEPVGAETAADIRQIEFIRRNVFGGPIDRRTKHLGEAMTCYLLKTRAEFAGAWWVTDDTDALRYARHQGITTMETIDLIRHAISDYNLTADEGFRLLSSMVDGGRNLRLPASAGDLT